MNGWQPIDTAPKDGTHVILWLVTDERSAESLSEVGECRFDVGFWDDVACDWENEFLGTPTHWHKISKWKNIKTAPQDGTKIVLRSYHAGYDEDDVFESIRIGTWSEKGDASHWERLPAPTEEMMSRVITMTFPMRLAADV